MPDDTPSPTPESVPAPVAAERPPAPPGYVPPMPPAPPAAPEEPAAYEPGSIRTCSVEFAPGVLAWVPIGCLIVVLVLSFFAWVGSYPGGHRVFSQSAWEAAFGALHSPPTAAPQVVQDLEPQLREAVSWNPLMFVYVIVLVLAIIFTAIERSFPRRPDVMSLPGPLAWVPGFWPYRFVLPVVFAIVLLFLIVVQSWRGFGLNDAAWTLAHSQHAAALEAADTSAKKQIAEIEVGLTAARLAIQTTTALDFAILLHVIAVLAILARIWLSRRGNKPLPRLTLMY